MSESNLIRDLMEYGEVRLYNCDRWTYVELYLEIPAEGKNLVTAKADTLELAIAEIQKYLKRIRQPTLFRSDHN